MTTTASNLRCFDFESYGVNLRIAGTEHELVDWGEAIARKALMNDIRPPGTDAEFASVFQIDRDDEGRIKVEQDGRLEGLDHVPEYIAPYFNSLIRSTVAENAADRLFIHAGAVSWKGKGIVFPGTSFVGKSTLVAELLRHGAEYFSDDYAIFDTEGKLYPFPRILSMRADDETHSRYEVTAEELGAVTGEGPLDVRVVCFTEYSVGAVWRPEISSTGRGALDMVPFTFSFINRPEFSFAVLNRIAEGAIIVSSQRGSADNFVETFLEFVDNLDV